MKTKLSLPMAAVVVAIASVYAPADAYTYSVASTTTWSNSCDCHASPLTYTSNQADNFDAWMAINGHWRMRKFANWIWASDYIEDTKGGMDDSHTDDSDIVVYSGHGWAGANRWGQTFYTPLCFKGSYGSCWADSEDMVFGEVGGPDVSLAPHYAFVYEPAAGVVAKKIVETLPAVTAPDALALIRNDERAEENRKASIRSRAAPPDERWDRVP